MILHLHDGKTVTLRPLSPLMGYGVTSIEITAEDAFAWSRATPALLTQYIQECLCLKFVPPAPSKDSEP